MKPTVSYLGRCLQIVGLIVPPVSLMLGLGAITLFASLGFSVALFSIGRLLEGYAGA